MTAAVATAVFVASSAFLVYVIGGYPLLLGIIARLRRKPIQRSFSPRSVSIVIAVRNGEQWIARKLASIAKLEYPRDLIEVIVVSDGSTDRTEAEVSNCPDSRVHLLRLPRSGKAAAVSAGLSQARNEIVVFTDVRQELEAPCLRRLIECFADPAVGVVSGDVIIRGNDTAEHENIAFFRRYETWIRDRLSDIDSMFGSTGCLYAVRRELARPIPRDILLDDMYQPVSVFFQGYRVVIDVTARAFDEPFSLNVEFTRKVRTLAGNFQLIRAFPALMTPKNRMMWHFLSYKFARLLVPYALIAMAVSSIWLPGPLRTIAITGQIAFYALAMLDRLLPDGWIAKEITSAARAFVFMVAADLCACVIFFVPGDRLWTQPTYAPGDAKAP